MDVSAAGANARGASLPMSSSSPSRREWRAVAEHNQTRSAGDEDLERSKLGQTDERAIYEVQQGREPLDGDFDRRLDLEFLQQRLQAVATQREELQQMEIELRAQVIVRSEIMEMQNNFNVQLKEHANAANRLQEQLHEREQAIHELERRMEEKDREFQAIKLDNEAAWAKEDLLREQNEELATFRRERDHSEVERTQHIKQLHELQEHIQEKERQLIELQEEHRVAQGTILYKDDQLREAQAWIARVQEIDAFQSNSLQAELRDRTEQYNQLWHVWQRQFAEMEGHYVHTVRQLHLELADARERSGTYNEESRKEQTDSKDVSQIGQNSGTHVDENSGVTLNRSSGGLPDGNSDNVQSYASAGNASTQAELVAGTALAPPSLLGVPGYLPPGQVPALHPFVMHQQGVPHSVPSHVPQSQVGHFQSVPAISSLQQWQNQQAMSDGSQLSAHNQIPPTRTDQNILRSDAKYEMSVDRQAAVNSDYIDAHISQGTTANSVIQSSTDEHQVLESTDRSYLVNPQPEQSLEQISSQFHAALRLNPHELNNETKEHKNPIANHGLEADGLTVDQTSSGVNISSPTIAAHSVSHSETTDTNVSGAALSEPYVPAGQDNSFTAGKVSEAMLLDERSLLACVVRTIPPGGRIRISSTLPNRVGKMLAPLHWHDYRKKYGKLEDFVASHPELFVIEGDFIQLRGGAQEMIAATAAVAKVAAAAAASAPHSSFMPSVAVTPMAQSHRLKKVPYNTTDNPALLLASSQDQHHPNGVIPGGSQNVNFLSKSKDHLDQNGLETRPGQSNGVNPNRSSFSNSQMKGSTNGKPNSGFSGKQPGRTTGAASTSRR